MAKLSDFVYKKTISVLFCGLALYLLILAGFSTSVVNAEEQTYLIRDHIITNLLFSVLFLEILILLKNPLIKKINNGEISFKKCKILVLALFTVISIIYVISARKLQNYDSKFIFDSAREWREGIYISMEPGGYAESHPNNKGIILLIYLFSYILGPDNYLAFQIINVIFLVLLYNAMVELGRVQGTTDASALILLIICVLFFPLNLYAIYTYGVIIGISCMVNSLLFLIRFLEYKRPYQGILSIMFAFVGVMIKQNGNILLLGMIIFLSYRIIKKPNKKCLLMISALIGVLFFLNPLIKYTTDTITNTKTGQGISMNAYIAMGFNEDSYLYPGWYNVYVDDSYREANLSTKKQSEMARGVIRKKLEEYTSDPWHALDFFSKKNASQWNNPDFEAVWLLQYRKSANNNYPKLLEYIESVKGAALVNRIANRIQFIILFGVLFFAFLKKRKTDVELYYCMVIIGGFIFHTFWEAKCQYILPYFVLMLPLSAAGYTELLSLGIDYRNLVKHKRLVSLVVIVMLVSAIVSSGISKNLTCVFARYDDTVRYENYVAQSPQYDKAD